MDGLDEHCLAIILSFLTPSEICTAATVSKSWNHASLSDVCWSRHLRLLSSLSPFLQGFPNISTASTPAAKYRALCGGVYLQDKSFHLRVNPRTGGITLSISFFQIVAQMWIGGPDCWALRPAQGAIFPPGLFLKRVYMYDVSSTVRLPFRLPPAEYAVSWRMARDREECESTTSTAREEVRWRWSRRLDSFQCTEDLAESGVTVVGGRLQSAEAGIVMSHHTVSPLPVWGLMSLGVLDLRGEENDTQSTELADVDAGSSENRGSERGGEESCGCQITELEVLLFETSRAEWKRGIYVDALVLEQVVLSSGENTSSLSRSKHCIMDPTISMDELMERLRQRGGQQQRPVASSGWARNGALSQCTIS